MNDGMSLQNDCFKPNSTTHKVTRNVLTQKNCKKVNGVSAMYRGAIIIGFQTSNDPCEGGMENGLWNTLLPLEDVCAFGMICDEHLYSSEQSADGKCSSLDSASEPFNVVSVATESVSQSRSFRSPPTSSASAVPSPPP